MNNFLYNNQVINKKKIIIAVIIVLVLLFMYILFCFKKGTDEIENPPPVSTPTSTIFYSVDKHSSVELPNSLNLKQFNSDSSYLFELKSDDYLNIFIARNDILPGKALVDIATADKDIYLSNFENISNVSEIKELLVGENLAYLYSVHYLDSSLNEAFYLQVVWLQIDNEYYIFDIEFPLNDLSLYTNIATDVLSTFNIY